MSIIDVGTDKEILNHTGPGTPLGELLRRFWVPALKSEELAGAWAPPVRLKLLNEPLVAYKDTDGRIALLQEFCAHRRASLFFARNESENSPDGQIGLRCSYHGWKYDVTGRCIDMPNEPPTSRFKEHVQIKSYPCVERGGVIWAYMGPAESMPGLPELEWAVVPDDHRALSKRIEDTCFTQAMEGGIDSSHISFLHGDGNLWGGYGGVQRNSFGSFDTAPRFFIEPTDYGLLIGARRNAQNSGYYWRITQWIMPWYTYIPGGGPGSTLGGHAWVPIDDEHCWAWSTTHNASRPLNKQELQGVASGLGIHSKMIGDTGICVQNASNDYLIDRRLQAHMLSLSGISGVGIQDCAMQESMGPHFDPDNEMLGSADAAILASRKRLLAEARSLATGAVTDPSGLDPASQRVRSISATLTEDESWIDATAEARKAVSPYYASI